MSQVKLWQSLSNAVSRVCLVSYRREVPQQTRELQQSSQKSAYPWRAQPVQNEQLMSSNGIEAGATVVRTTAKAYDGTTVLMSDTIASQQSYHNQKSDVAFRCIKLVVWFCVNNGRSRLEVAMAAFTTSEWKLARQLYATLNQAIIVVADSAYGTYGPGFSPFSECWCRVSETSSASCDFRRGRSWAWRSYCPMAASGRCLNQCPPEDLEHYQQASKWEVHLLIQRPGTTEIILVTTLWTERYPKAKLFPPLSLASSRVIFKHLKTTLKMEWFCQTRKWCRNLDAFACVQLAAAWSSLINAAIAECCPGCHTKELDCLDSISSDQVGSRQRPKPSLLLQPCSMSSVINRSLASPSGRQESPKETKSFSQVWTSLSNPQTGSRFRWRLQTWL